MSFFGSLLHAIPVVGDVIDAIDGSNHAKSQSAATAHAGSQAQLASNQAQALMQAAAPIRAAATAALLKRLQAGPSGGIQIPDLRGVVDQRNPFRKNFAMPSAPMQLPPLAPPTPTTPEPTTGGGNIFDAIRTALAPKLAAKTPAPYGTGAGGATVPTQRALYRPGAVGASPRPL